MKAKEKTLIKSQLSDELKKELHQMKINLEKTSLERFTKPSKNVHNRKMMRKKIALIATILREREEG